MQVVDERRGDRPEATRLRRDVDDQARHPLRLGDHVVVGGRVETTFTDEANADFDETLDRRREVFSRVQLLTSAVLGDHVEAYAKVSVSRSARIGPVTTALRDVRVQEAYLIADRIAGSPLGLQVGRQRFRDSREWFYDEYMDAVRVRASFSSWLVEGAVADGIFAGAPASRSRRDKRQWLFSTTRYFDTGPRITGFVIRRDDHSPSNDDPLWIGALAELKDHPSGWSVWSLATSRRGSRAGVPLSGWAVDAGVTYRMVDATAQPSVTLSYARATGDALSGDGRDTTFRQTDLEDNSARFGGFRRLAYYGELFDPELSNLRIWTAGLGMRPSRALSIDIVGHQVQAGRPSHVAAVQPLRGPGHDRAGRFDRLRTGRRRDVRTRWGVDLDLTAGVFSNGPAFGEGHRPSGFLRPQVRFYF